MVNLHRLPGWWRDLPVLLPLTVALAPIAIPPALLAGAALAVFGLAELLTAGVGRLTSAVRRLRSRPS